MEKKLGDISIGDELTNQEIVGIFKCGNQGGMRRSKRENCLILITDHTKSLYDDHIDSKGILHYTGMGTKGDQDLNKSQNRTLNESKGNDIKVYFFEKYGQKSSYRFNGEVELDGEPYEGKQYDRNEFVKEYARRRAAGRCQLCDELAPFESNGVPFLEVHHVEWLAEGGPDSVDNVVALCPNCHRKMHVINKPKDVQTLVDKAKEPLRYVMKDTTKISYEH